MALGAGPIEFHVTGLCRISVFTPQQYLGYSSENGVHIVFDPKFSPVYTDAYGDQVPEDIQNMGMLGTIDFELIKWDQTVLAVLQTHLPGVVGNLPAGEAVATALGNSPNSQTGANDLLIGSFLKQCGWNFPVIVKRGLNSGQGPGVVSNVGCETNTEPGSGGNTGTGYIFYSCYLGPDAFNNGSKNTRHGLTINVLPNASGQLFGIYTGL